MSTSTKKAGFIQEFQNRQPILFFGLGVLAIFVGYYALTIMPFYEPWVLNPVSEFYAAISSGVIRLFGIPVEAIGRKMSSPDLSINIAQGCDGIAPIVIFVGGILIYTAPIGLKLKGLAKGILILVVLNWLRIITLFLTGLYAPELFDFMHQEFWQVVFIGIAVLIWLQWLNQVTNDQIANH